MPRIPRPGEVAPSVGDTPPRVSSSPRRPTPTGDTGEAKVRTSRAPKAEPVSPKPTKKDNELQRDIAQLYTLTGVIVGTVHSPLASSIVEHSDEVAEAWVELSKRNSKVRRALEDLTTASVWGGIVSAHAIMLAPVLPGLLGSVMSRPAAAPMRSMEPPQQYSPDPTATAEYMSDETIEAQLAFLRATDPSAYGMAMMALGRDTDTGGPGDTVRVNSNGTGIQTPADLGL